MQKLIATTVADIDMDTAWRKLSDLAQSHNYVPDVTDTIIITAEKTGVGTSRRIISKKRPPMIETVVEWDEGKGFRIALLNEQGGSAAPFKEAYFNYAISAEGDNKTRMTNSLEFQMKWGPAGALLAKLIAKPLQRMQQKIVVGQRLFYETGQPADPEQIISILKTES